jgi:hypothetical protein
LEKYDAFLPTENILGSLIPNGKYCCSNYLTLAEIDYPKEIVIFVDRNNLEREILDNILLAPRFGIDCETCPVYNTFEKGTTEIVQIALDYQKNRKDNSKSDYVKFVYIFDLPQLIHEKVFTEWFLKELCSSFKGKIVGHSVKSDFLKFVKLIKEVHPEFE